VWCTDEPVLDSVLPQGPECAVKLTRGCYGADKLRIGVLTLCTTRTAQSAHLTAFINALYTAKWGYSFIVERCAATTARDYLWRDDTQYQIVWHKSLYMLRHLPFYDYLLFMDSDSYVIDHDLSIEQFVNENLNSSASIATQSDCYDSTPGAYGCWDSTAINTGLILAKNTPKAFEILRAWAHAPETDVCREFHDRHPREQLCLQQVAKQYKQGEIQVIDTALWRGLDGTWIQHAYESRNPTWFLSQVTDSFSHIMHRRFPGILHRIQGYNVTSEPPWLVHPKRTW
jgi:hypothetical protein